MDNKKNLSLDITMREFLSELLDFEESRETKNHSLSLSFFKTLSSMGYSYYELLSIYAPIGTFSVNELEVLFSFMPTPIAHFVINSQNIRQCISRWTASRYHTAPIGQVVEQIEKLLVLGDSGISTFDSNLNPKNQKSVNDRYVLFILSSKKFFIDINRRLTYRFISE